MKKPFATLLAVSLLACAVASSFAAPGDKDKKPVKATKGATISTASKGATMSAVKKGHGKMSAAVGHGKAARTANKKGHGTMAAAEGHGKMATPPLGGSAKTK